MNSKTTKSNDLLETLQSFQQDLSEIEKDKSISEATRTAALEGLTGLFSYLLYLVLEYLIRDRNWYVGILVSSQFLEDVGNRRLRMTFKGRIDPERIGNLRLEETIMLLLASGTIDYEVYQKLMEVKNARNDLAHDPIEAMKLFAQTGVSDSKESQHARSIIEKAGFCLRALRPHRREKKENVQRAP